MSEYVWRYSSKAFRSLRDTCVDDSGALYCDIILPLNPRRENNRREREKYRSYIRSTKSTKRSDWEDDDSSRIAMQQASQRQNMTREKKMHLFSRLLKIFMPHSTKPEMTKEKIDLDELNSKLDQMIATLDGENDWFVECHPVLDDDRKE